METLNATIIVRGVEFEAQCEFDYTTRDVPPDYVPYGESEVAIGGGFEVASIDAERVAPAESIYRAALQTLIQRGRRNNAKTRKHARYLSRRIANDLATKSAFEFIDEDNFTEHSQACL